MINETMLLSFEHMKNTNCHKIVQNLKIRFNGEVYEGAWHLSKLERMYDFVHLFFEIQFSIKF